MAETYAASNIQTKEKIINKWEGVKLHQVIAKSSFFTEEEGASENPPGPSLLFFIENVVTKLNTTPPNQPH